MKKLLNKRRVTRRDDNREMTIAIPPNLGIFLSLVFLSSKLLRILYFLEDETSQKESNKERRQARIKATTAPCNSINTYRLLYFNILPEHSSEKNI